MVTRRRPRSRRAAWRPFRDTWVRGLAFASFLVIPAATAYAVIACRWPAPSGSASSRTAEAAS
jgi:hypothetical protein